MRPIQKIWLAMKIRSRAKRIRSKRTNSSKCAAPDYNTSKDQQQNDRAPMSDYVLINSGETDHLRLPVSDRVSLTGRLHSRSLPGRSLDGLWANLLPAPGSSATLPLPRLRKSCP
jgi:hypothetical protein